MILIVKMNPISRLSNKEGLLILSATLSKVLLVC